MRGYGTVLFPVIVFRLSVLSKPVYEDTRLLDVAALMLRAAIAPTSDHEDCIANAYVTPIPEVERESFDEEDWERVRGAVLSVYG